MGDVPTVLIAIRRVRTKFTRSKELLLIPNYKSEKSHILLELCIPMISLELLGSITFLEADKALIVMPLHHRCVLQLIGPFRNGYSVASARCKHREQAR